jgi:hypothetical protein
VNAFKYGAPGRPVAIQWKARAGRVGGVHNEGAPISASIRAHLRAVSPGTQAACARAGRARPTSRTRSPAHGGALEVRSEEGRGPPSRCGCRARRALTTRRPPRPAR